MALLPNGLFDFETQTPDALVAPTGPWELRGTTEPIIASAAAAMHGTLGGRISAATASRTINRNETQTTATRCISAYIKPKAVAANAVFFTAHDDSTARADARINTNHTVTLRNVASAVATSTFVLDMDVDFYRFDWLLSTLGQEMRCFEGESTEPVFSLAGALTSNQITRMGVGLGAVSAGFSMDFDTIRVGDDWFAPVNPAVPLPTPVLTAGAKVNASTHGGSDGSQVVTWPPVAGAGRYAARKNDGSGPVIVSEDVTSPFTFTGLAAGAHELAIRAYSA